MALSHVTRSPRPSAWIAVALCFAFACSTESNAAERGDAGAQDEDTPPDGTAEPGGPDGGPRRRDAQIDDLENPDNPDNPNERDGGPGVPDPSGWDGAVPASCRPTAPPMSGLPAPCTAALPTGYCLRSSAGDYIGAAKDEDAQGATSVVVSSGFNGVLSFQLNDDDTSSSWRMDLAAPAGETLKPGLYENAERYPFQGGTLPGLSISGNGRGCNMLTGRFSIAELARDPATGVARFSATFEQHCEGGAAALSGVVNFEARGEPDVGAQSCRSVALTGKVGRVTYDPTTHTVYGLDATNRRISTIDLTTDTVRTVNVVQVPNDACVDPTRQRLYVVNKGSSLVLEYDLATLTPQREFVWTGTDWGPAETHFHVYCAPDRLYLVDGAWAPALFTVEDLDSDAPQVVDHTAQVASVGGLVLNSAATDFYTWEQIGWSAGNLNTSVRRYAAADYSQRDITAVGYNQGFVRDPLDAPVLLDEQRGYIFSKNRIFDAENLTRLVFTLPGTSDSFNGAGENAYANHVSLGLLATKNFVYELERFDVVAPTLVNNAQQQFFDRDGLLWFLETAKNQLSAQFIPPR